MSREKSIDEVKAEFIEYLRKQIKYWNAIPDKTTTEKLNGLVFSMLAAIDGEDDLLPSFILAPRPHSENKEYQIKNGENYYPENHLLDDEIKCDIAGDLHELFFRA